MKNVINIFLICISFFNITAFANTNSSIAFYYENVDSVRELINYQRVVVTPSLITPSQIKTLKKAGTEVFAYLSVGEYDGTTLPDELQGHGLGKNPNWGSYVMDLSASAWQEQLMSRATELHKLGFDGLFLDTLDSYTLYTPDKNTADKQLTALTNILERLKKSAGNPSLIFNRGFEILNSVTFKPYALVAESLYHSYDPLTKSYQPVAAQDTEWLKDRLSEVKSHGIETIVIDYLPASDRKAQKRAARKLLDEGYTPYVSDGMLYEFGVSTVVPVTKRVLGVYDGSVNRMVTSQCHRMLAMPIEYYGYVPECVDIRTTDFEHLDMSRYAAVVMWVEESSYQQLPDVSEWIKGQVSQLPLLFLGALPTNPSLLERLGIQDNGQLSKEIRQTKGKSWTNGYYPAAFSPFEPHNAWIPAHSDVRSLIEYKDNRDKSSTLLFKAPWGGALLAPYPVANLANNKESWLVDPFRLIEESLSLPIIPAADATTESGHRILTAHVDGDGFPSKAWFPGKPYTAEVLYEHVFKKYRIPQTVSIIQGEVGPTGLYPKESEAMENVARKVFKLGNVEVASHTYSHPFIWDFSDGSRNEQYGDNLPIPGYSVDYYKEIIGSRDYINEKLTPENKKVAMILWSGRADPTEEILNISENANLLNVNGGNTYVVNGDKNLAQVSPTIAWYPTAIQVYAPVMNENLYTNLWAEHHDGFGRAIETFKILGAPRRLKTIGIYYHMYSGTYPASLKAVMNVYDWALKQDTTPLYLSEYARRARTLYETGIAKTLDGAWQITSSGVKSVRFPNSLGYPSTKQIAGWNDGPDGKYLILSQSRSVIEAKNTPFNDLYLKSANGQILEWHNRGKEIDWKIKAHQPLRMQIAGAKQCQSTAGNSVKVKKLSSKVISVTTASSGTFSGTLRCQT